MSDLRPAIRQAATMSRRSLLAALATGAAGYALWPRARRTQRPAPPGRQVITYWEKWTTHEGAAIQRVVDDFNASQDRIWVRREPVSSIQEKALLAIAGGDPPDLVGLFSFNIPQCAESGAALPLDRWPNHPTPERYAPAVWSLLTYEGRPWAGVNTCYTFALYYNRAHFREAGLDPDRPPRTIAELDDFAQRLTRYDGAGRLVRAGFLPNVPPWWPFLWPAVFGGRLFDAAGNRATTASPQNIAAFEWVRSWPGRFRAGTLGGLSSAFEGAYHTAQDPFLSGRVSMIVQGPWIANVARQLRPDFDYGCGPLPVADEIYDATRPVSMIECDVLMIPRGCPHPDEAFEFFAYTQRPSVQEALAFAHCKSSPTTPVSDDFFERHPNRYVRVHDALARSPRVQVLPQTRVWPEYHRRLVGVLQAVWAGASAGDELRRLEPQMQALLDSAARRRARGPRA